MSTRKQPTQRDLALMLNQLLTPEETQEQLALRRMEKRLVKQAKLAKLNDDFFAKFL